MSRRLEAIKRVARVTGNSLVDEAVRHWQQASEWEYSARERIIQDLKFRHGDSDNGYQWPNSIRASRNGENKPCLTMNLIRQHNLQISNQARKNKSSVQFIGTAGEATQDGATIIKEIMRRIEYQSSAQDKYTTARNFQVDGGIGWWRLYTDYASEDTFDQEIFIGGVDDPLSIYLDSNIQEKDGSDANWGFVFDTLPEEEFYEAYPQYEGGDHTVLPGLGLGGAMLPKDHIMVCEYFRRVPKKDTLISFLAEGGRVNIKKSLLPENAASKLLSYPTTKTREIMDKEVEWNLICGEEIIDSTIWLGKYIPLIRVIGETSVIDGQYDIKGHTRWMKDAQRMYNYNASAQVEFVALQGKTPWVGPAKAIEEFESMWNSANLVNHSFLPYNHTDDQGNPIPTPVKTPPPTASPAYQAGMETAFNQMMMTSGQYQNQLGMQGNERTGKAIGLRQQQGDTATFHFEDNYASALLNTGKQILDLIPKVYDTKRIFKILAEDGTEMEIQLDPSAQKAYQKKVSDDGKIIQNIFNPNFGTYDVAPAVGPAYGTRREETRETLTVLLTQNPALANILGDIFLASMDFAESQEAARRMKRMVPPQALGEGPSQAEQAQAQQLEALKVALAKALEDGAKDKVKLAGRAQARDIDVYQAETQRISAMKDSLMADPEGLVKLVEQLIQEALAKSLSPVISANSDNLDQDPGDPSNG